MLSLRNAEKILGYLNTNVLSHDLIPPHVNFSHLTAKDYNEMYRVIMTVKEGHFKELGLDACLLEDELDKVPGGIPNRRSRSPCPLPVPGRSYFIWVAPGTWIWRNCFYRPSIGMGIPFPCGLPSAQGSFLGCRNGLPIVSLTATSSLPGWGAGVDFCFLQELFSGTRETWGLQGHAGFVSDMLLLSFWPLSPKQSVQGTGLAFIAFTEAMTHFPASPFWSVMFFLMLINLGLGSMIGTMSGITTPIIDTFKVRKEVFTGEVFCILLGKGWRFPSALGVIPEERGYGGGVPGPVNRGNGPPASTREGLASPLSALLTVPVCSLQSAAASSPL